MKEYTIKNTDYRIRYHDFPGKEIPILFIHGLGCAGSFDYPEVAAHDELRGHRCILLDMLGAGYSDKPNDFDYTISGHAKYVSEFIEHLNLDKFILFGHSLGGAVALTLASICEDKICNIILSEANLDSGGGFTSKAITAYSIKHFIDYGYKKIIENSKKYSNEMWAASFLNHSPKAAYIVSNSVIEGQVPSWRDILYSLKCPKTFIYGEKSLPDPNMETLINEYIHIEVVKNAGHSMAWENPKGLAIAIKNGILFGDNLL